MKQIEYDYTFMLKDSVGKNGINLNDLKKLQLKLKEANKKFLRDYDEDYMAFHRLPDETKELLAIKYTANKLRKNFENLLVFGIGGSDLGSRAVIGALKSKYHNDMPESMRGGMRIYFAGSTTDPKEIEELLEILDMKKTAFHVISKSGNTIETMSNFFIAREKLIKTVGKSQHHNHIVATTSPHSGNLIKIVEQEGYTLLPHGIVGGRFSALSSVGLLASACAGINIDKLLQGANSLRGLLKKNSHLTNPVFTYAAIQYLAFTKKQQNIAVLMPYDYKLYEFSKWYRQLWAESLGKDGKGQTPVSALGPTDQHSQLQLYQDGPADKNITFIVSEKRSDLNTPEIDIKDIRYFGKKRMSKILYLEYQSTALSLMQANKPSGTLIFPELDEFYLGQLIYFFELAVAYSGEFYKINAFNQPGVELSKKYLHAELGNSKLKDVKKELEKLKNSVKRKIS